MDIHVSRNPRTQVANYKRKVLFHSIFNSSTLGNIKLRKYFFAKKYSLCLALLEIVVHVKEAPPVWVRAKISFGPVLQGKKEKKVLKKKKNIVFIKMFWLCYVTLLLIPEALLTVAQLLKIPASKNIFKLVCNVVCT